MAKDKLDDRTSATRKELDRTPKAGSASTLGGMANLTPLAKAKQQEFVAKKQASDLRSTAIAHDTKLQGLGVDTTVRLSDPNRKSSYQWKGDRLIQDPTATPAAPRLSQNETIAASKELGSTMIHKAGPDQLEALYYAPTGSTQAPRGPDGKPGVAKATGGFLKSMQRENAARGLKIDNLNAAIGRQTELGQMREVADMDLARKTQLADPRYLAEVARARVQQQFEQKRLLASFQKPSNPIMMVSGGSTIYRGGDSEEDQIDLLEEQTLRHLTKRKRLGMPLEE